MNNDLLVLWHKSLTKDENRWWEWKNEEMVNVKIGLSDFVVKMSYLEESFGMITLGLYEIELMGYAASIFRVQDLGA